MTKERCETMVLCIGAENDVRVAKQASLSGGIWRSFVDGEYGGVSRVVCRHRRLESVNVCEKGDFDRSGNMDILDLSTFHNNIGALAG